MLTLLLTLSSTEAETEAPQGCTSCTELSSLWVEPEFKQQADVSQTTAST